MNHTRLLRATWRLLAVNQDARPCLGSFMGALRQWFLVRKIPFITVSERLKGQHKRFFGWVEVLVFGIS